MTMITIPLSDERLAQLRAWAEQTGLTPEEFLQRRVEQLFRQAQKDRAKAYELKHELDRLGVYRTYEDRFLDLFKKPD